MSNYGNSSIRRRDDLTAVRENPATYAGTADRHGAFATVREIISNSIDEFKALLKSEKSDNPDKIFNYDIGKEITVTYDNDGYIIVKDNGRGVPMDWNEVEEDFNYNLIYCELNAGGKYNKEGDDFGYDDAIGLNGMGSAVTILSSEYAEVISVRDGYKYSIKFKDGVLVDEMTKEKTSETTGTTVKWIPSLYVFDEVDFTVDWFVNYLEEQSIVNKGLKLILNYKDEEPREFIYENGIVDYFEQLNEHGFTTPQTLFSDTFRGRDTDKRKEYNSRYEVIYGFNNVDHNMMSYHNSSYLTLGGSPHDAIKSSFVYEIERHIRILNLYNKKESRIKFEDIQDSLLIITNTYSTLTSYQGQTKFAITNKFIKDKMNELLRENLHVYFIENPKEAELICKQVLANKRAREKAEKTRVDTKKKLTSDITSMDSSMRVNGLINCKSKDKEKTVLAICEGKSALSSLLVGRTDYHAIFPIRGKVLNCFKAPIDRILANEVIMGIYKALGCGLEIGKKGSSTYTFDIDKMNFHDVEIYVDADEDGIGSIFPLLLSMFWKLTPTLMREGRIKLGRTPKYEIQTINDQYYAMDDSELETLRNSKELKGKKYELHYIKGLAELSSEGIAMAMDRDNNQTIQVQVDDEKQSIELLELFMGDKVEPRKEYILSTFEEEYEFDNEELVVF